MHGTLRFILAFLVALSHLGVTLYNYNIGVFAVVIFYLLAGMVAYKLNQNYYPNQPILYYKDRLKRIFPLYLAVLTFTYIIYLFGASSYFISIEPDFEVFISNLTVIPLSYFMYSGIDKFTLIPPVWSLGVELQFYLLAPFILLNPKRVTVLLFLSLVIYILATIGILNTDHFGYRLLAGVLFIFLIGAFIQQKNPLLIIIYFLLVLVTLYTYIIGYKAPYNYETLLALLIGIPLLKFSIIQFKYTFLKNTDKYLGTLSYAFFLLHFPVLWLVELFDYSAKNIFLILCITFILSVSFIYIEKCIKIYFIK